MVKNLSANAGDARDAGSIPGSGRSPGVFLPEKFHGQKGLAGGSPWLSDVAEPSTPLFLVKVRSKIKK